MRNRIACRLTFLIAAAAALTQAQAPTEFEAASVKPNRADDRIVTIHVGPGGSFAAGGYTLVLLIQRAYGVMDWNVSGGPVWIRTDRYDVVAKANVAGNLTEGQLRPMLARLLADRFKLKLHESSRQMAGYALVVAKGGPKLTAAADTEEHRDSFNMSGTGLNGQGITMETFARFVGGKLGLIAVDQTGLKGVYDLKAEWRLAPDQPTSDLPGYDSRDALRAAVIAALQHQLGLKLTPRKVAVRMLVIDNAEKASASEN